MPRASRLLLATALAAVAACSSPPPHHVHGQPEVLMSDTDDEPGAARAGESLEAFSARTANAWQIVDLAVANDLFADATLTEGQLVKIAVEEAYVAPATSFGSGSRP